MLTIIKGKELLVNFLTCIHIKLNIINYNITWGFFIDELTIIILLVICTISFLVHIYTFSYILIDPHRNRFFAFLSLFTFFIILLVTASNYIQLFVGWEGVGICSFLLISF